jgi:hypothetical protein
LYFVGTTTYRAHIGRGGGQHGRYDALDYRKIKQGNADPLGTYQILSVLPDKFARFLFEFHSDRFESLDLPVLPGQPPVFQPTVRVPTSIPNTGMDTSI